MQGYFSVPNQLLAEGCGRPVALAVYARLASTRAIWTARGDLGPFETRASLGDLVSATGASRKQVRGALTWLVRGGYLVRREARERYRAVYRIVVPIETTGAQMSEDVTPSPPMSSATAPPPQGHSLTEKGTAVGTAKGTAGAQSNGMGDNGLESYPQRQRAQPGAQPGAQVFKDSVDKRLKQPPPTWGGIVGMWSEAFDGKPPSEPRATHDPDRYRRAVLERATAGETPEDVRRMFASWVAATDPDWGQRQSDGVGAFAAAVGLWTERRNIERQHARRWQPERGQAMTEGTPAASSREAQGVGGVDSVCPPPTGGGR